MPQIRISPQRHGSVFKWRQGRRGLSSSSRALALPRMARKCGRYPRPFSAGWHKNKNLLRNPKLHSIFEFHFERAVVFSRRESRPTDHARTS